jgi:reactive intermediate/imine deaminase
VAGKRFLNPETLAPPAGYTHAVDVQGSRLVFISGQVALDAEGQLVGAGDLDAQTRQVFDNLAAALAAADASWSDVVKLTYFVRDVGQVAVIRAVRDEYVDTERPPASSLVEISRLVRDEFLVEIEAVAIPG